MSAGAARITRTCRDLSIHSLSRRRLPLATLTNGANSNSNNNGNGTIHTNVTTTAQTSASATSSSTLSSSSSSRKSLVQQPTRSSIHVGHSPSSHSLFAPSRSNTTNNNGINNSHCQPYVTQPAMDDIEDTDDLFDGTLSQEESTTITSTINGIHYDTSIRSQDRNISSSSLQQEEQQVMDKPQFESDLVVVLDMDECLIHSQFFQQNHTTNTYRQQEASRDQHSNKDDDEPTSLITSACESFRLSLPDGDLVQVHKRPNLDLFLQTITSRYETHVFTAAMSVYASPLLDVLDPDGAMFQQRFYREDCTLDPKLGVYVKDLSKALSQRSCGGMYNEQRAVLVDNNPFSFLANPSNGILVSNFYDDPKDDTLQAVMELLHELEDVEDVRTVLDAKFGLTDALKEVTQNPSSLNGWR